MTKRIKVSAPAPSLPEVLSIQLSIPKASGIMLRDIIGPTSMVESAAFVKVGTDKYNLDAEEAANLFDNLLYDLYSTLSDVYPERDNK